MKYMHLDPSAESAAQAIKGYTPAFAMELLRIGQDDLAITDIVPPSTWSRMRNKQGARLNQQHSEAVFHAARAMARVNEVLGADPDVRRAFLHQPNAALDGHVPLELLSESSIGAESVIRVLDSLSVGGPL